MAVKKGKEKSSLVRVNITTGSILKIAAFVVSLVVIYYLSNIVFILLLSLLLAALIDPAVKRLQRRRISRGLAIAIVYAGIFLVLFILLWLVLPTIFEQTIAVLTEYAPLIEQALGSEVDLVNILNTDLQNLDIASIIQTLQESGLADAAPKVIEVTADFFKGVLTTLLIFILAFYMVIEESALKKGVDRITPEKYHKLVLEIVARLRKKVGAWLNGQLALMLIIFTITYISLLIIGVPYALVLALIAGTLEIVPFLGPILAVVPAVIVAISLSPIHALIVMAVYFLIQQLEGEVLTPKIMQKAIGLNPIVSIVAILIGFELFDIIGAILAIPFAMVISVFIEEWFKLQKLIK